MGDLVLRFEPPPVGKRRAGIVDDRHQRRVYVRFSACMWGEMQAYEAATRMSKSEICRRGAELLLTGYPVMSEGVQAWLAQMASVNDFHGDPQGMLDAVLEQLMASYPTGRRLRSP